ncbi:MAG: invasion associated locus B family protein [bacterium]
MACSTEMALAQTAEPSSTAATYGNWTVTCATQPSADGAAAGPKTCQMTTRLNLKGNDGQTRPLLEIAIGKPANADAPRIVLQVPIDVALREPIMLAVGVAAGEATDNQPREDIGAASYFACAPTGCVADTALTAEMIAKLKTIPTTNVTFTALADGKKITVPVAMTGFGDAWAALDLPSP